MGLGQPEEVARLVATSYTVVALHRGSDAWARQVFAAVRARLRSGRLGSADVHYAARAPSTVDGPVAAVCLASRQAAADADLVAEIEALQDLGVVVVPVWRGRDFSQFVPAPLARVQGVRWEGSERDVSNYIVRALGLAEADRRIFISYGRRDAAAVASGLWTRLTERGFDVFLDRFGLKPGEDWARRLDEELADKAFVVMLETDAAAQSRWVQHEVIYALKNHLGLQVLSLPGSRADRECAAVPEAFRYRVSEAQLLGSGSRRRLRASGLNDVVSLIEAAHDDALLRRRNYLLLSASEMVARAGWRIVPQPAWSMLAESDPGRRRLLRIVPRPPRPQDLRRLDASRRDHAEGGVVPHGHLVYESADLDPALGDLLAWIAADRGLSTTPIQAVAAALEVP